MTAKAVALCRDEDVVAVASSHAPSVARNTLVQSLVGVLSRAVGLLFTVLIARRLGDESLGAYRFALTFVSYFGIVAAFGLGPFLVREMAADLRNAGHVFAVVSVVRLALAALCVVAVLGALPLLGYSSQVNLLVVVLAVTIVTGTLVDTNVNTFYAFQRMELGLYVLLAGSLLYLGLGWLALDAVGALGVAVAAVLAATVQCIVGIYLINKYLFRVRIELNWKYQATVITAGSPFFVGGMASFFNDKVDVFLLSQLSTFQVIGWYSAAYLLLDLAKIAPGALSSAIYPTLAASCRSARQEFDKSSRSGVRVVLLITCLMPAVFVPASQEILRFLFGVKFDNATVALQVLMGTIVFYGLNLILGSAILAAEGQRPLMVVNFLILAVNLGLNLWLIPSYAHLGASVATIGSYAIGTMLHLVLARRLGISSGLPLAVLRPGLAAVAGAAVTSLLLHVYWILAVVGGSAVYVIILWALHEIGPDDIRLARSLLATRTVS